MNSVNEPLGKRVVNSLVDVVTKPNEFELNQMNTSFFRTVTIRRERLGAGRLGAGRLGAGRLGAGRLGAGRLGTGRLGARTFRRLDF